MVTAMSSKEKAKIFHNNEVIFLQERNSEDLFQAEIVDIRHSLDKSFIFVIFLSFSMIKVAQSIKTKQLCRYLNIVLLLNRLQKKLK